MEFVIEPSSYLIFTLINMKVKLCFKDYPIDRFKMATVYILYYYNFSHNFATYSVF